MAFLKISMTEAYGLYLETYALQIGNRDTLMEPLRISENIITIFLLRKNWYVMHGY